MILGVDEVGRGPWAGPLVVGAVVLGDLTIDGLSDSKKISKKNREKLDLIIRDKAAGFGLGWVDAPTIDRVGLSTALRMATRQAVEQIKVPYSDIVIDGTINFLSGTNKGRYATTMKKADALVPSVSAASIIAKVARDNYMIEQDRVYPQYGFAKHVGYGTAAHIKAIDEFGVTPLHRLSFRPLASYRKANDSNGVIMDAPLMGGKADSRPTTKQIGDMAEDVAANYLMSIGHTIIARNWKTKACEIDIISNNGSTLYFVEVKYRRQPNQGGGMAAITPSKLHQMKRAAEIYMLHKQVKTSNVQLAAISMTGQPPVVESLVEIY